MFSDNFSLFSVDDKDLSVSHVACNFPRVHDLSYFQALVE